MRNHEEKRREMVQKFVVTEQLVEGEDPILITRRRTFTTECM